MRFRWLPSLCVAAALSVLTAHAAVRPPAEVDGPLGLVRVTGGGYREARDVARQAEDILHRMETLTGRPIPVPSKPLVRLALPISNWGYALVETEVASNGLPWRIEVVGPLEASLDDLQAELARLAISLWSGKAGRPLGRADWLAVGLAGNLFPTKKALNREWTATLADENRLPSLETIFTWNRIPPGPMLEKAACAQAVGWMLAAKPESAYFVLDRLKAGGPVPGDWLVPLLGEGTPEDPEAAWRLFASRRDLVAGGQRPLTPFLFQQFKAALQTPSSDVALEGAPSLRALSPSQLLAIRGAPGGRAAARARAEAIQKWAVGTPPELAEMALRYKSIFNSIAGRTPAFWVRRHLLQAERDLREREDLAEARRLWMSPLEVDDGVDAASLFNRSVLEQYVDEWEARAEAEAAKPDKGGS